MADDDPLLAQVATPSHAPSQRQWTAGASAAGAAGARWDAGRRDSHDYRLHAYAALHDGARSPALSNKVNFMHRRLGGIAAHAGILRAAGCPHGGCRPVGAWRGVVDHLTDGRHATLLTPPESPPPTPPPDTVVVKLTVNGLGQIRNASLALRLPPRP